MPGEMTMLSRLMDAAATVEGEGGWEEALARYEAAFRRLPLEGDAAEAAELMRRIGRAHRERGEVELAAEAFETALEIAEASGLEELRAQVLNSLAVAEQLCGRLDAAEPHYLQARELAEVADDQRLVAMVDQNLATLANLRGDAHGSLSRYRSALERHRALGDELNTARTLINVGMALADLEAWSEAESSYVEALEIARGLGDAALAGMAEQNRAELYLRRQRFEDARASCERALDVFRTLRMRPRAAAVYKLYGMLYRETSRPELARTHFALALGLAEACRDPLLQAETEGEWAQANLEEGEPRTALRRLNRARRILTELRARRALNTVEQRLDLLRSAFPAAAAAWGEAVAANDHYRAGHAERVAELAGAIADEIRLDPWDRVWLRVAAHLHDVGTSALPEHVLLKPGLLTTEERALMQTHTVVGDAILAEMDFPQELRGIVRHHHERWDGAGYPDRLRAEAIPIQARILTLADVFDALTTPRRYRPAYGRADALGLMRRDAGRALDPELFASFEALV